MGGLFFWEVPKLKKRNDPVLAQQIFNARVKFAPESPSTQSCSLCDDELVFALSDGESTFSVSLTTILKCLEVAEVEGCVPKIDRPWWYSIQNRYGRENFGYESKGK